MIQSIIWDPLELGERPVAARRDHRRASARSSGAPSGSAQPGKLTSPPVSRTISWPAAASTPREPRSDTIPSNRAAGDLAQRGGDRAEGAQPVARSTRCRSQRHPARVGGLDPEHLEPPVAAAALGQPARAAARSSQRALASPRLATPRAGRSRARTRTTRPPSSRRRRPRSRARVGEAALGVQRAVDRVDDHAHRGSPKSTSPRSSETATKR